MDIVDLIYGRLLLVTGKGGVGKSSAAAAFGRLAAAQGRRTLVVELDAQHSAMEGIFGVRPEYEPRMVSPDLYVANLDWFNALTEWMKRVIPVARVVNMILDNRVVQLFLNATPGNREVVLLSKLVWLLEEYDLVVVDLPASGHATLLLELPASALRLFRTGPIHQRAEEALEMLSAPTSHLVMVALPEEMVVNETIETWKRLRGSVPTLRIPLILLNRAARPSLTDAEVELLSRLSERFDEGEAGELLLAGRWEASLERATDRALRRLSAEVEARLIDVPRFTHEHGDLRVIQQLTAALARSARRSEVPS